MIATSAGHVDIVNILVLNKAETKQANHSGITALHYAASKNRIHIAKLLIANGADVNATDKYGITPLHRAVSTEKTGIVEALIQANVDLDIQVSQGENIPQNQEGFFRPLISSFLHTIQHGFFT